MSSFSQAVRQGTFSRKYNGYLVEGTVATTLAHVAQAFRSNNRKDPRLDSDGKICFILQEQYRGYANQDKAVDKQKALPIMVLKKMYDIANSHKELALSQLCIGAIFFAMRSCEYLSTSHKEDSKRTKILRLRNIQFKKNGMLLHHNSHNLASSDLVIITFEFQKNDRRNKAVHMFKTNILYYVRLKHGHIRLHEYGKQYQERTTIQKCVHIQIKDR